MADDDDQTDDSEQQWARCKREMAAFLRDHTKAWDPEAQMAELARWRVVHGPGPMPRLERSVLDMLEEAFGESDRTFLSVGFSAGQSAPKK